MSDTEVTFITASCSFPGEEPTAVSIPITGNMSEAIAGLKVKTMEAMTLRMAGDANAADEVDLMEEVIEEEDAPPLPPSRQNNKGTKRKKPRPSER